MSCLIPMSKVVKAAIKDTHEDYNKCYESYTYWGIRILRALSRQTLKTGFKRVILPVNKNTGIAMLPPDCKGIISVGIINIYGEKMGIHQRHDMIPNEADITSFVVEKKCSCVTGICAEAMGSETVEVVNINGTDYDKTTKIVLHPNGSYIKTINKPVVDASGNYSAHWEESEVVNEFILSGCGCVDTSCEENVSKLKECNFDIYCLDCLEFTGTYDWGYNVFDDNTYLKLDKIFNVNKVYIEYIGDVPKLNGEYVIPELAFEAVVEGTKFMAIDGRKNIPISEKMYRKSRYDDEVKKMKKEKYRINFNDFYEAAMSIPQF